MGYTSKPIRRVRLIAKHYLKNDFIWDFIPLIPLQLFKLKNRRERLFFLIKIYRLKKGFKLFDVSKILKAFKKRNNEYLEIKVNEDSKFANNKIVNNNKIERVLLFKFTLKIFKLVILILNSSYLLGMLWLIWC